MQGPTHVAAMSILEKHEELLRGLKGILEPDNEGMFGVRKHVTLSFGIFDEIVPHYLLLVQDLHCILLACVYRSAIWANYVLLD